MTTVQHIGNSESSERELFCLSLPDFNSKPDALALPSENFIVFLAADASRVDTEMLRRFAYWLLEEGCVYFRALTQPGNMRG